MTSPEQENSIDALQTRLVNLYQKFEIDPTEEVNFGDTNFMLKSAQSGSKEWAQTKLAVIVDMIQDASLGGEYYKEAADTLLSLENYEPIK